MHFEVKYFYKNGTEMKKGDLVYLEGSDSQLGLAISGIFQLISISEDTLTVYFLGQDKEPYQAFDVWIDTLSVLMPVEDNKLSKVVEEAKRKIFDKIKNRE